MTTGNRIGKEEAKGCVAVHKTLKFSNLLSVKSRSNEWIKKTSGENKGNIIE